MIYMELKLAKRDVITLIEDYYKRNEGKVVKAKIETEKVSRGYGCNEYDDCSSTVKLEEEVTILGTKAKATTYVADAELKQLFTNILEESSYSVEKIAFDDGISYETVGAYMYEKTITKPYCNGLILNVKSIAKQKTIGGK